MHEELNIKSKRITYVKDIPKQVTEKNVWTQHINKKRMEIRTYFNVA